MIPYPARQSPKLAVLLVVAASGLAATLVAPLAPAGGVSAQSWRAGASVQTMRIPTPFVTRGCEVRELTVENMRGLGVAVVRASRSGVDLTLQVAHVGGGVAHNFVPATGMCRQFRSSGEVGDVQTVTVYPGEVAGDWSQSAELGVGYSPPSIPFRVGVGAGWIAGAGAPYAAAVVGIRTLTRIRLMADLGVHVSSVPYVRYEEETRECLPDWSCSHFWFREEMGQGGREWTSGRHIRIGVDIPLSR